MSVLSFKVLSSSGEGSYVVEAVKTATGASISCSCDAGRMSQQCKHRANLLNGLSANLASENVDEIETLARWFEGSDVMRFLEEIATTEREIDQLKAKLSKLKKAVGRAMAG